MNSVCARLKKHDLKAFSICITMKDNRFNTITRQCSTSYPTNNANYIFNRAFELFLRHYTWENPLRSIGVRAGNLVTREFEQLSLFDIDECEICFDIDERVKKLTARLGELSVEKSVLAEELLS